MNCECYACELEHLCSRKYLNDDLEAKRCELEPGHDGKCGPVPDDE